ncbi:MULTISPECIES: methyl-accepting chemotaxis protein [unclassified Duganella]|uniref:methyl-accepting chemotaxis protein n=1 Tax=unclassified Duganella TaxID=2636909 RepID=UPI0008867B74|nr:MULTISPECIES: methyl-accepting chemotaxis protein [unclassified Duganella]SDF38270.1 methyl-accepting chemotaxis sensory transducer with TarH sensor [Duganella sp. OV458]SDI88122.1 methyl-accepting chemotaxis sensory transducer with TarH sensor [Duganella sp. OV510]
MFANLKIRTRLIGTMALLGVLIIFIGVKGIVALHTSNNVLKDVYSNSMVSMKAIYEAQIQIDRARLSLDRVALAPDAANVPETLKRSQDFIEGSNKFWSSYYSLPFGAGEKELADKVAAQRDALIKDGLLAAVKAINDKNKAEIDRLMLSEVTRLFRLYTDSSEKLSGYQLKATAEQYDASQSAYDRNMVIAVGAIVVGIVLAAVSGYLLLGAVMGPLTQSIAHFQAMAHGNLSNHIEHGRKDEMGEMMEGLQQMQERLAGTVRSVREGSDAIATASSEIAAGNLDLSRRTEQQAASLEETASSLEELTSTVRQNSDNARQANTLATSASDIAVKGGELVTRVIDTMGSITQSSDKIADIIGVIDGIAFQTNILALNAAVEAARAGEQGRGFAVVATEVRNLAQRSAAAAKDIKALITDSVEKVGSGSALVNEAGTTMEEIVTSVKRVTDIISEISSAGREQEIGIEQINTAVAEMDTVTQQNAALVEEAAAASQAMQEQAVKLAEMVAVFQVEGSNIAARKTASAPVRSATRTHTPAAPARKPALKLTPKPAAASAAKPAAAPRKAPKDESQEWEEF